LQDRERGRRYLEKEKMYLAERQMRAQCKVRLMALMLLGRKPRRGRWFPWIRPPEIPWNNQYRKEKKDVSSFREK